MRRENSSEPEPGALHGWKEAHHAVGLHVAKVFDEFRRQRHALDDARLAQKRLAARTRL